MQAQQLHDKAGFEAVDPSLGVDAADVDIHLRLNEAQLAPRALLGRVGLHSMQHYI